MATNYGQKIGSWYKINKYALLDIALIASKQTGFRSNEC